VSPASVALLLTLSLSRLVCVGPTIASTRLSCLSFSIASVCDW